MLTTRRRVLVFAAAGLGLALILAWLGAVRGLVGPVSAADYCVTSYGTVQLAIDAAGDGDTIRVPTGTYVENLQISSNIILQGGWNKGCSSRVTTDPSQTVIDGNASGSVISISSNSTATLEALTITNGQSINGGGVYVSGASPTLDNVVVSGNVISTTLTTYPQGGGVYVGNGTITLKDCDIMYNTAYEGAATLA